MIISHSRKFIFIKTRKTGGTSLELALSKYCDEGDIITPVLEHEEELRRNIGGMGPCNYELPLREHRKGDLLRHLLLGRRRKIRFQEHTEGWEIRRLVGPAVWESYYRFTIVRHPYERMVSAFYFARTMIPELGMPDYYDLEDIDQFLRYRSGDVNQNWRAFTENDQLLVHHIVRLERLREDLAEVSERIGLQHNLYDDMKGIRTKDGFRPAGARARDLLDERQKQLISLLCAKEMALCGYAGAFDEADPQARVRLIS